MSPKSGKAGSPVSPAEPQEVYEADDADPGKIAEAKKREREKQKGKYGSVPIDPFKPASSGSGGSSSSASSGSASEAPVPEEEEKVSWIEIEMIDEEDQPVAGLPYEITIPDGTVATGTLDEKGLARVDGMPPGECKIKFPTLDKDAWESA